jgi:hypothetical protein
MEHVTVENERDLMAVMQTPRLDKQQADENRRLIEVTLWNGQKVVLTRLTDQDHKVCDVTTFQEWFTQEEIRPHLDLLRKDGEPFIVAQYKRVGPSHYARWTIEGGSDGSKV